MNVIFTCGGTAGHVNPALALAGLMQSRDPGVQILFVGSQRGMERRLIEKAGYAFRAIEIDNFHRSFSPAAIRHNLHTASLVVKTPRAAKKVLDEFRPDLIVGTGGYASYPMVKYGAKAVLDGNMPDLPSYYSALQVVLWFVGIWLGLMATLAFDAPLLFHYGALMAKDKEAMLAAARAEEERLNAERARLAAAKEREAAYRDGSAFRPW